MTNWGYILIVAFVALGLTQRVKWRKASRAAVGITVILMLAAFVNYHAIR